MKTNKASGNDYIISEMLKHLPEHVFDYFKLLFNKIFETGQFPDSWTEGIIVPLFKSGDNREPGNYRGITLLSIFSKVFTTIINKRLTEWVEGNGTIFEGQAGFRSGYATVDNIFTLHACIQKHLQKRKGKLYVAFVDFQRAYDSINRNKLFLILSSYGLGGRILNCLKGIYKEVRACVRSGNLLSEKFMMPLGPKTRMCLESSYVLHVYQCTEQ